MPSADRHPAPHSGGLELLAPAGSAAAFLAAMEEGADAVYVGAPGFNARALARDLSFSDIAAMISTARARKRKLYVAMNSLVKEDELPQAVHALATLAALQPDALIIQDLGLADLAKRYFPELTLHASTLMSITHGESLRTLAGLGFSRAVLARELSLDEILAVSRESRLELEIFIHGAMCFSYSGLCLFSSLHGGKSSLRGRCVQPCRRRYSLGHGGRSAQTGRGAGGGGYLFSMNDLCGASVLHRLAGSRVRSLKIEGRLKSSEYVRKVVAAYRMVLDSLEEPETRRRKVERQAETLLDQAMGRKRSRGYLVAGEAEHMVSPSTSGNVGDRVGQVRRIHFGPKAKLARIEVKLSRPVASGDRMRLWNEERDERWSLTVKELFLDGRRITQAGTGQVVAIALPAALRPLVERIGSRPEGLHLYRVDSRQGRQRERGMTLAAADIKTDRERGRRVLEDLGIPDGRGDARAKTARPARNSRPAWWIRSDTLHVLNAKLPVRPDRYVIQLTAGNLELLRRRGGRALKRPRQIVWALPPVLQPGAVDLWQDRVRELFACGFRAFQVAGVQHLGILDPLASSPGGDELQVYGDYTGNLLNSVALESAWRAGMRGVLFSLESDRGNLEQALARFRMLPGAPEAMQVGLVVYGRPPLFTARFAPKRARQGKTLVSPQRERFVLREDEELVTVRADAPFSLLAHLNQIGKGGVTYLVLDISGGPMRQELAAVGQLLHGAADRFEVLSGNYQGVLQ